jgi:hypothetical protein
LSAGGLTREQSYREATDFVVKNLRLRRNSVVVEQKKVNAIYKK